MFKNKYTTFSEHGVVPVILIYETGRK